MPVLPPTLNDRHAEACLRSSTPFLWLNPEATPDHAGDKPFHKEIDAAERRFSRARGLIAQLFPETGDGDIFVSALQPTHIENTWVKCDHALPLAGSIKARGGFHEVLAHAERLALRYGLIREDDDLACLAGDAAHALFARHTVSVGSTGNLGLSVGVIASALGFRTLVHMSREAKDWKKARLRDRGVMVVEHAGDYGLAVAKGRRDAEADPLAHFIDDERSVDLLTGYAAAARELATQLAAQGIEVGEDQPLLVYIPCGVGGAAGGITLGLKRIFGRHVHCFFIEPVASPCMLVQLASRAQEQISVHDFGLDNRTDADGLAVAEASMLVASLMRHRLSGVCTVSDDQMFALLLRARQAFGLDVEPSAATAFCGPLAVAGSAAGKAYLKKIGGDRSACRPIHIVWTTGGSLVPDAERAGFLDRAAGTAAEFAW